MILPIFPEGGLASSVITTVWVGVFVLCFFNLRFGWVLSGLVVPGYLVPLLIVKPLAAGVIVIEAVLTYTIVWVFSEKIGRGKWPSLFGRDRFMGLILASVAVRMTLDGFVLPEVAEWMTQNWNREFDWRSDMQSFGLVIISLMANQFWKPGIIRGMFSLVVVTALSLLIIRYGLMEFTNFRISGVSYLYEGLASSVLASPKAYMILVLTALYASHMNVKYGWDFSGILIPALIALQWYQPTKILASFGEAIVIYAIARMLLKTPWLENMTIEGGRKMLLFFNISFALKLIVGHAIVYFALDVKTTDFYGFGYLLSTLLAIKAHDKNIFPRLMRSTLQVSFVGAAMGNLAGFLLALILPQAALGGTRSTDDAAAEAIKRQDEFIVAAVGDAYSRVVRSETAALSIKSARALGDAIELLEAGLPPVQAGAVASSGGWRVEVLSNGIVALRREDGIGRDVLLYDPAAEENLAITVPDPTLTPGLAHAAQRISELTDARWLVFTAPRAPGSIPAQTVLQTFRQSASSNEMLVGFDGSNEIPIVSFVDRAAITTNLPELRKAIPELVTRFDVSRIDQNEDGSRAASRAVLTPASINELNKALIPDSNELGQCVIPTESPITETLTDVEELAFLRFEVAEPLLKDLAASVAPSVSINNSRMLGLALEMCAIEDRPNWLLTSRDGGDGAYLFTASGGGDTTILGFLRRELRQEGAAEPVAAMEFVSAALSLQWGSGAGSVLLAPRELQYDGKQSHAFGVINQTVIRQLEDRPALTLQIRPFPQRAGPLKGDPKVIIIPLHIGISAEERGRLRQYAFNAGFSSAFAERSKAFAGYEAFPLTALRYLNHSQNKRAAVLMINPDKSETD
ncbi:hypothetical protein GCM10023115_04380 [Pontixanthobacter gangjinensis]|uniref:Capsule biosynthesis CapC n=1 Tax=Pontixanthobacter gangjinensis TaxID=1028742 RepID=A0A6I4SLM6_9SPHN|nr:poly-gamma-glutamate biosynthesis protein PgsC/CapC [Pontixanthobacter gangjinensis]MXO55692.1 hypothetical protein [Pontixanthobacter gangjinensis]